MRLPFESSPHDEAEEESWHDNVPQAEHGEVSDVLVGGEDELAGQGEAGRAARHPAAHGQLARHHAHGVFGGRVATRTITLALNTYWKKGDV